MENKIPKGYRLAILEEAARELYMTHDEIKLLIYAGHLKQILVGKNLMILLPTTQLELMHLTAEQLKVAPKGESRKKNTKKGLVLVHKASQPRP